MKAHHHHQRKSLSCICVLIHLPHTPFSVRRVSAWRHSRHSQTRLMGGINGLRLLKSFFMSHKFHTLTFLISSLHLLISGDLISLSHLKIDYHFRKNSCYGFCQFHFFFLLIYSKNQLHRAFTVFIIFLFF